MKKLSKSYSKNKKSILSAFLATVLAFSFNYSPISMISNLVKTSNAYKSSSLQSYYGETTSTSESKVKAYYPEELAEYFSQSKTNFNIETYYNTRFDDLFKGYANDFLISGKVPFVKPDGSDDNDAMTNYSTLVRNFLTNKKVSTLYEYFENNKTDIKADLNISDFRTYVEYFVSHEITWTISDNETGKIPAAFTTAPTKTYFYCSFANFLNNEQVSAGSNDKGEFDNLPDDSEAQFYQYSIQYKRLKDAIDAEIVKTMAIYSYDGQTKSNTVAGILADDAPVSSEFYYKDNSYTPQNTPKVSYSQKTVSKVKNRIVYYFGTFPTSLPSGYTKPDHLEELDINKFYENPLQYRLTLADGSNGNEEYGYIPGINTFYKYESIPFATTKNQYDLYVVDDSVTDLEKTTYASLGITVLTSDDIDDDADNAEDLQDLGIDKADSKAYFKVPYDSSAEHGDIYFNQIFSFFRNSKQQEKIYSILEELQKIDAKHGLYLKYKNNTDNIIYYDPALNGGKSKATFIADAKKEEGGIYDHLVVEFDYNNLSDAEKEDYCIIPTTFSGHNVGSYTLYFEKTKTFYQETNTTNYDGYVTKDTPVDPYEYSSHLVPTESYKMTDYGKEIFALVDNKDTTAKVTIDSTEYFTVDQFELDKVENRNFYVEVPEYTYNKIYGANNRTYKLYFKHEAQATRQLYVVDDTKSASTNEVYKNLYYNVITSEELKLNKLNYVAVESTDANYNKNFKLYYRYDEDKKFSELFVQNEFRRIGDEDNSNYNANAVYIVDSDVKPDELAKYKVNLFNVVSTEEFNQNKHFYVLIQQGDSNYDSQYTKLYYKYKTDTTKASERVVYIYTSGKSDKYQTFYKNNTGYVASDYELIPSTDTKNYVEGTNLYYKKNRVQSTVNKPQMTYYYYQNSSTVSLKANKYYAISFYVYTNGYYDNAKTMPIEASFYLTDSNGYISDISLEHISSQGKWTKYYMFVSTDLNSASAVSLKMYLGDKTSILGSRYADNKDTIKNVTGVVLFDNIRVTTINYTDFTKRTVDDKDITDEKYLEESDSPVVLDVVVANDDARFNTTNVFDNRAFSTLVVGDGDNSTTWDEGKDFDDMFNFDEIYNANKDSNVFTDIPEVTKDTDGYSPKTTMWSYYIGRDVSGLGNSRKLEQYQEAYMSGNLSVSLVDEETEISKTITPVDEDKDDDKDKDDKDKETENKETIASTFNPANRALKLENTNSIISLGITSNAFKIEQFRYYKITVWVFAPDKEATASITLNSVIETASTPTYGTLLTKTISLDACYASYTTAPTNEYGWIPCSFYVEGNALHDQLCYLVLSAGKDSTVYFDNITIENVSSSAYDTVSSDSDNTTNYLSLTNSSSVISNGVTNGYFNNITFKNDYKEPDVTTPRTAKSWTIDSNSSSAVIAGVVPTNKTYTSLTDNFYKKYNKDGDDVIIPYSDGFDENNSYNNVFAIYAPSTMDNPIEGSTQTGVTTTNMYKLYSSSISLSANGVYEISFDFFKGYNFKGSMIANLYYGSKDSAKIISSFKIDANNLDSYDWETFKFYVASSYSTASVYLEIGVTGATGTCFFKDALKVTSSKSLTDLRDELINANENLSNTADMFNKQSLQNYRFVDFAMLSSSTHGLEINKNSNTYNVSEYKNELVNTSKYTVGKSGVAVATFFAEEDSTVTYTVTINKTTYYIGEDSSSDTGYSLYKYSCCCEDDKVAEIDGSPVVVESNKKVVVGKDDKTTDYASTKTEKKNYLYTFEKDVEINNIMIPAAELTNNYSDSVMILANSYSTDFITLTPAYTTTLSKTSFYVLKIYVKTSDFADEDTGLNINVASISTSWKNINTTVLDASKADENGFVCYQIGIKTADSSIASFGVTLSLGSEKSTCKGYAIIADIELEKYATEADLEHYISTVEDDEITVKKYYSNAKDGSSSNTSDEKKEDAEEVSRWATFFYIFSSLLLALVIGMALVAVFVKKHPVKHRVKATNDHEKDIELLRPKKSDIFEPTNKSSNEEDSGNDGIL